MQLDELALRVDECASRVELQSLPRVKRRAIADEELVLASPRLHDDGELIQLGMAEGALIQVTHGVKISITRNAKLTPESYLVCVAFLDAIEYPALEPAT